MTKQKSSTEVRSGSTRGRAASPAATAIPPVEKSSPPAEQTVSVAEEEAPTAWAATPAVADAAPLIAEASPEVALVPAPPPVEVPTQIILLAGEAEANGREERSGVSFSWSTRSVEFWRENAQALYRLASELGAARTPGEIVEAHSKFAVERLRAFGRHAEEMSTVRAKYFFAA